MPKPSQPVPDLGSNTRAKTPQVHYDQASRYLQRCDALVKLLDDDGDWDSPQQEMEILARLAHAHAELGASR